MLIIQGIIHKTPAAPRATGIVCLEKHALHTQPRCFPHSTFLLLHGSGSGLLLNFLVGLLLFLLADVFWTFVTHEKPPVGVRRVEERMAGCRTCPASEVNLS
jgi:hypothetical protein